MRMSFIITNARPVVSRARARTSASATRPWKFPIVLGSKLSLRGPGKRMRLSSRRGIGSLASAVCALAGHARSPIEAATNAHRLILDCGIERHKPPRAGYVKRGLPCRHPLHRRFLACRARSRRLHAALGDELETRALGDRGGRPRPDPLLVSEGACAPCGPASAERPVRPDHDGRAPPRWRRAGGLAPHAARRRRCHPPAAVRRPPLPPPPPPPRRAGRRRAARPGAPTGGPGVASS